MLDAWGLGTIAQASQCGRTGDLEGEGGGERYHGPFTDLA